MMQSCESGAGVNGIIIYVSAEVIGASVDKIIQGPNPDVAPAVREMLKVGAAIGKEAAVEVTKEIVEEVIE